MQEISSSITVFTCYAFEDEALYRELDKYLLAWQREGIISARDCREIIANTFAEQSIDERLATASIIFLLISPAFMEADYCNSAEMQQALERHIAGDTRIIPILLRPADWSGAPFAHLPCFPRNARPVNA